MILPVLLLLAAASTRVELVDEVFDIPKAEWRYVELSLRQLPATVTCHFETANGESIRLALLRREDLARFREERPHGTVAAAGPGRQGDLQYTVHIPGAYYVIADNREESGRAAKVHLRISLDFSTAAGPHVRTLSTRRQAVVIALSFAVFFGVVLYAGRRLLRTMRR